MIAAAALALGGAPDDPGYRFARALALAGPRPGGSAAERRAHARVEARFRSAVLRVGHDAFAVPGHGRSRNVVASTTRRAAASSCCSPTPTRCRRRREQRTTPRASARWWRWPRGSRACAPRATFG